MKFTESISIKSHFGFQELEFVVGRDWSCIGTHLVSFNSIHMHLVNLYKPFSTKMDMLIIVGGQK